MLGTLELMTGDDITVKLFFGFFFFFSSRRRHTRLQGDWSSDVCSSDLSYWLDPKNHVSYQIATQTPQYRTDTLQDLQNAPVTGTDPNAPPSLMASLVSTERGAGMAVVSDYNVAPVIDIFGSVAGRDLGGVSTDINKIIDATRHELPRGSRVVVRGQVQTMRASYIGLLGGLVGSVVLVYLLIVVNFQSWLDPFIMISALPAALSGIAWFLFVTHTTLSVPAL